MAGFPAVFSSGEWTIVSTLEDPLTTRPSKCTKWDVYLIGWGKLVRLGRVRRAKAEIVVWIEWGIVVRTT